MLMAQVLKLVVLPLELVGFRLLVHLLLVLLFLLLGYRF
jgi:hypothetical protein